MPPDSEARQAEIGRAIRQLGARDERTVLGAIHALSDIGAPAFPALLEALIGRDARLRCGAARTLGYLRSGTSVPALLAALTDDEAQVREAAAQSLGWIGDRSALASLTEALQDGSEDVREKSAVALRDLGALDAIPALKAALEDESHWVRRAARKSIWKLHERESEKESPL